MRSDPKVAYVIGPYRGPTRKAVTANIISARTTALKLWRAGIVTLCPHLNTAHFDHYAPDIPDQIWLDGAIELMKRCDFCVCAPGYEKSEGSQNEILIATQLGMRIFSCDDFGRKTDPETVTWNHERNDMKNKPKPKRRDG